MSAAEYQYQESTGILNHLTQEDVTWDDTISKVSAVAAIIALSLSLCLGIGHADAVRAKKLRSRRSEEIMVEGGFGGDDEEEYSDAVVHFIHVTDSLRRNKNLAQQDMEHKEYIRKTIASKQYQLQY